MAAFFLATAAAHANDSVARVGAGGITLLKTDRIRMLQDRLEISTKRVHVRYRFLNEGGEDLRTTVAFPMPVYGWNPGVSASNSNERPLASLKLRVDGHPVPVQSSRRAVVGERDVTDQLRKIGLTEPQIFETFGDCNFDRPGNDPCGVTESR